MLALKAIIVLLLATTGEPVAVLKPAPVFHDHKACIAFARKEAAKVDREAGKLKSKFAYRLSCEPVGVVI
jgi:hypothetical protein